MIRYLIIASLICTALPAQAMLWFCTAALEPRAGADALPDSPTVFELDIAAGGRFVARGEDRFGRHITGFDWDGTWTDLDGQLALIGPKRTEDNETSEMRAFSTHVGQFELIFELTDTAPWTQTVRCLKHDLS